MTQGIYEFFRQVLIVQIIISLYWPLNIPLAALAYKIRGGMALKPFSFWLRSSVAALGMACLSVSLMGFDQTLTHIGLPPGPVHIAMFLMFVPLGAWWMFTVFKLRDKWEGLTTLLLFVFVPGLVLVLVKLVFGYEPPHFVDVKDWIDEIPV